MLRKTANLAARRGRALGSGMDELLQFGLRAFATLFVVVDPLGVAPMFVGLTEGLDTGTRRRILARAILVAFSVTMFFLLGGGFILTYLGVTVHAFAISGGALLFIAAMPMLFGQRTRLQAPERNEERATGEDIAIFPLAIPLLSGPGAITTVLLLTNQARGDLSHVGLFAIVVGAVYAISWAVLAAGDRIMARLGEGKVHIITRVLGIVLAALAVQYILGGIAGFFAELTGK
jgi:multiple antibiotic resistance protein